jgi:hypothetical protein
MGALLKPDNSAAKLAQKQAEAAQRRAMAEVARQNAEADQAKAAGGRKRGRKLLTFLGADGQATLG